MKIRKNFYRKSTELHALSIEILLLAYEKC